MTMKKINAFEQGEAILKTLSKGAFLTTAADGKQNTMTIGWGSLGFKWGQPTFTVMVRQSRYTKELIDANPEFTVSFPVKEGFAQALGLCGSKSGRDLDKFGSCRPDYGSRRDRQRPCYQGLRPASGMQNCRTLHHGGGQVRQGTG